MSSIELNMPRFFHAPKETLPATSFDLSTLILAIKRVWATLENAIDYALNKLQYGSSLTVRAENSLQWKDLSRTKSIPKELIQKTLGLPVEEDIEIDRCSGFCRGATLWFIKLLQTMSPEEAAKEFQAGVPLQGVYLDVITKAMPVSGEPPDAVEKVASEAVPRQILGFTRESTLPYTSLVDLKDGTYIVSSPTHVMALIRDQSLGNLLFDPKLGLIKASDTDLLRQAATKSSDHFLAMTRISSTT